MSRLISRGTEIAFAIGEATSKARGGCAPGLRRAVALHKANLAPVDTHPVAKGDAPNDPPNGGNRD